MLVGVGHRGAPLLTTFGDDAVLAAALLDPGPWLHAEPRRLR
jgi:hypothetical protein